MVQKESEDKLHIYFPGMNIVSFIAGHCSS